MEGPKGTLGGPREPKGPRGPLGLFRSYSEWKAIPSGWRFRTEGHSEWADLNGRSFREGPKGTLGGPREPKGTHGPWGLFRSYSEWKFRVDGDSERKAIPSGWLFRVDGQSEWKVISRGTQGDPREPKGTQGPFGVIP